MNIMGPTRAETSGNEEDNEKFTKTKSSECFKKRKRRKTFLLLFFLLFLFQKIIHGVRIDRPQTAE